MNRVRRRLISRALSCSLSVALVFGPIAGRVPAAAAQPLADPAGSAEFEQLLSADEMPAVVEELVDERTEDSRYLLLEDGGVLAEYYSEPIHYEDDATGDFEQIETAFVEDERDGRDVLVNGANSFEVELPADLSGDAVSLSKGDARVSLRPVWNGSRSGARLDAADAAAEVVSETELAYEDAFANATLQYESLPGGLKETIVVAKRAPENTYSFRLETDGLEPRLEADGSVSLFAPEADEPHIVIPAPCMWDSHDGMTGPAFTDRVSYTLVEDGEAWRLDVIADRAWLDDPERVYPVCIDPTLYAEGTPLDTYVSNRPGYTATNYSGSNRIWLNSNNPAANWTEYGLVQLPASLVSDLAAKKATGHDPLLGWVWLFHDTTAVYGTVSAKRCVDDVNIATATWNNRPATAPIESNYAAYLEEGWWTGQDITSALQYWQQEGTSQCTVQLEASPGAHFAFKSVERNQEKPLVSVYYAKPPQVALAASPATETILPQVKWTYTSPDAQTDWEIQVAESPGGAAVSVMSGTGAATAHNLTQPSGGWKRATPYFVRARAAWRANINSMKVWSEWTGWQQFTPVLPAAATGATAEWFFESDADGDGVSEARNDSANSGRGWVDLSWPACAAASSYRIYLYDGYAYRQVASVAAPATNWSTQGKGLFPSDTKIASLPANTTANQFGLAGGLDLRDDPRPFYAKMSGTAMNGLAAYSFKVLPYGTPTTVSLTSIPEVRVTLDARTVAVNQLPADTTYELGEMAGHDARAVLDEGALSVSVTDLEIASHGPAARLSRHYDSASAGPGAFGPGWRFSFERSIEASGNVAAYIDESGEVFSFYLRGGAYVPPEGLYAGLTRETVGAGLGWRLAYKDGSAALFDASGALSEERDRNGNAVTYDRTVAGELAIQAANGQRIVVGLDGGHVTGATYVTADGTRTVTYSSLSNDTSSTASNTCVYYPNTADERTVEYTYASAPGLPDAWFLSGLAVAEVPEASWTFEAAPRLESWARGALQLGAIDWAAGGRSATVTRFGAGGCADTLETIEWNPTGTQARRSSPRYAGGATSWTSYGYAPGGDMVRQVDAKGGVRSWVYDARGNLAAETDEDGACTTYAYGTSGGSTDRVIEERSPSGSTTYRQYDAAGNVLVEERVLNTQGQRARTTWTYDAHGRTTSEARAISSGESAVSTYEDFAPCGEPRLTSHLGVVLATGSPAVTVTESVSYDAFGSVLSRTDGTGVVVETNAYSIAGRQLSSTDASGTAQVSVYDALGRVVESYREAGAARIDRVVNTYDGSGNLTREEHHADGAAVITVVHDVDPRGWVAESVHSVSGTTTRHFDAAGNVIAEWAPDAPAAQRGTDLLAATRTTCDELGRVVRAVAPGNPDEKADTTVYSPSGRVLATTAADGTWARFVYDAAGNRVQEVRPVENAGATVTDLSVWDLAGRLTGSVKASGTPEQAATTLVYDLLGRQTSAQLGQPSTTTYNTLSQVLSQTDFDGIVTARAYDRAGRVVSESVGGKTTVTSYDGCGRVSGSTDPAGRRVVYGYDGFGRVSAETHITPGGVQLKHTTTSYDALSRPKQVTQTPANVTTIYDYATPANKVSEATILYGGLVTKITYDEHGRESARTVSAAGGSGVSLPSAVSERDAEGRRTAWTVGARSASAEYDAAGKLKAQTAPGISAAYTYDTETGRKTGETVTAAGASAASTYAYTDAGRLSGALTGTTQRTYDFDERGNLKTVTTAGAKTTYIVDANDRLASMSDSAGKTTYVFDALGRRTSQALSGTTATFGWDDASRLTSWTRGADSAIYTYDAAGQRTRTVHTQGGTTPVVTTTDYTYDGITLLALSAAQGTATWQVTYLYDEDGRPYAGVYTSGTAPVTFLIATNDRGDVVGLTNTAGTWFARYIYDPYGRVLSQTTQAVSGITATLASQIATRQVLRYASYAYDAHSATYYLAARHYDPASARFLTKDPARDDGEESAYQYCGGDPVGKVDPTGMWAMWAIHGPITQAEANRDILNLWAQAVLTGLAASAAAKIPIVGKVISIVGLAASGAQAAAGAAGAFNKGDYLHFYRSSTAYYNRAYACHGSRYTHYFQMKFVVRRKCPSGAWYNKETRYTANWYVKYSDPRGWTPLYNVTVPKPSRIVWI